MLGRGSAGRSGVGSRGGQRPKRIRVSHYGTYPVVHGWAGQGQGRAGKNELMSDTTSKMANAGLCIADGRGSDGTGEVKGETEVSCSCIAQLYRGRLITRH